MEAHAPYRFDHRRCTMVRTCAFLHRGASPVDSDPPRTVVRSCRWRRCLCCPSAVSLPAYKCACGGGMTSRASGAVRPSDRGRRYVSMPAPRRVQRSLPAPERLVCRFCHTERHLHQRQLGRVLLGLFSLTLTRSLRTFATATAEQSQDENEDAYLPTAYHLSSFSSTARRYSLGVIP